MRCGDSRGPPRRPDAGTPPHRSSPPRRNADTIWIGGLSALPWGPSVYVSKELHSNNQSAGKRRHGRTRRGNLTLREVLIECAHAAARTHHCQFRGYHKALTVRRGYKRATVATAHKLLRVIYAVLKANAPYRDPETDYEAQLVKRNAPRWIRMLRKYRIDPATGEVVARAA